MAHRFSRFASLALLVVALVGPNVGAVTLDDHASSALAQLDLAFDIAPPMLPVAPVSIAVTLGTEASAIAPDAPAITVRVATALKRSVDSGHACECAFESACDADNGSGDESNYLPFSALMSNASTPSPKNRERDIDQRYISFEPATFTSNRVSWQAALSISGLTQRRSADVSHA